MVKPKPVQRAENEASINSRVSTVEYQLEVVISFLTSIKNYTAEASIIRSTFSTFIPTNLSIC